DRSVVLVVRGDVVGDRAAHHLVLGEVVARRGEELCAEDDEDENHQHREGSEERPYAATGGTVGIRAGIGFGFGGSALGHAPDPSGREVATRHGRICPKNPLEVGIVAWPPRSSFDASPSTCVVWVPTCVVAEAIRSTARCLLLRRHPRATCAEPTEGSLNLSWICPSAHRRGS